LFFLAFLPKFVHPEHAAVIPQFAILGAVFVLMSAAYTSLLASAAGYVGRWLTRHSGLGRWQGRFIGTVYVGLGVRLAPESR
jgi:threonine/homoserine/homoserine lactone efflux protein